MCSIKWHQFLNEFSLPNIVWMNRVLLFTSESFWRRTMYVFLSNRKPKSELNPVKKIESNQMNYWTNPVSLVHRVTLKCSSKHLRQSLYHKWMWAIIWFRIIGKCAVSPANFCVVRARIFKFTNIDFRCCIL